MTPSARLSVSLQDIAARLHTMLEQSAGEPCAFVLVCQADGVAQYVSNADRKDGRELLQSLMDRWDAKRADIPAHYNPARSHTGDSARRRTPRSRPRAPRPTAAAPTASDTPSRSESSTASGTPAAAAPRRRRPAGSIP